MSSFEQKSGSASASASTSVSAPVATSSQTQGPSVTTNNSTYRLPSDITFQHASKLAIVEDKPILLDYWTDSLDKKALIGIRESGEKLLVKSAEEYTSPIAKFYKSGTEYIIITENSIYLVSSDIPNRKIS
jgi:hypothetical protein